MADNVLKAVTKPRTMGNLARKGIGVFGGIMVARAINTRLSPLIPSVGPVSGSTLSGLGTTAIALWGTRMATKSGSIPRDIGEMATVGAAAFTLGSFTFDVLRLAGISAGPLQAPIAQVTGQGELGGA